MTDSENKSVKYEDVVTTGITSPLIDVGIDYAEIGIDEFLTNAVVKQIPIVKTIFSLYKAGFCIKEWHFTKNFMKFLEQFHSNKLTDNEKEAFINKYNKDKEYRDKIVTLLITANDRYYKSQQSEIAGNLFVAFIKELISWEDYSTACECIDRFSPFATELLDELEQGEMPYHGCIIPGDFRAAVLLSCAFCSVYGNHLYTTHIGIIVHQYGIKGDYSNSLEDLFLKAGLKKSDS